MAVSKIEAKALLFISGISEPKRRYMEFLSPIAGYLALLALPIILFYILKVRLRQENVSTIIFWQQVFEERRTRSLWRRLRRLRHLLSLLLSLLFLVLLVSAVLNPVLTSRKKESRTVVIVDNSASMNAIDSNSTTRLDLAKAELARYLAGTDVGKQTAIISAGGEPQVVVGFTSHLGTLRKMVADIKPTDHPTELAKAVELARHLTVEEPDSIVLVYTDGCSTELEPLLAADDVRFVPVGKPLDNAAITQFQPRRSISDPIGYEILVEVVHFGEKELTCRLEVDLDDAPVDIVTLTLTPGVPQTHIVRSTTDRGGLLRAKLNHEDAFPLDNSAMALLPARPVQKLLFYGESDFFLGHVLQSQQNTNLTVVTECPTVVPDDAVLIVHRSVPETIPAGNVLVIDPQNDCDFCSVGETLESPLVANEESDSPLIRFVHLKNVLMPGAKKLTPHKTGTLETISTETDSTGTGTADASTLSEGAAATFTVLASTPEEEPIFLQWQTPERKLLLLSTELKRGDLALRTAFPIMISNALNDFRDSGGELELAYSTGNALSVPMLTTESNLALQSPSGETRMFPVKSGVLSLGTLPQCGLWQVFSADSIVPQSQTADDSYRPIIAENAVPLKQLACNLVDVDESNLRSAPESFYDTGEQGFVRAAADRPIWFWLVVIAILFTTVEWFLYQRRWVD